VAAGLGGNALLVGADRVAVKSGGLEGLDIGQPIDDASADFQISWPTPLPAPLFERAWRKAPTLRKTLLIYVMHSRLAPLRASARYGAPTYAGELALSGPNNLWPDVKKGVTCTD
jgi:hypothetical protein